jgi:hypothetical protein
MRNTTGTTKSAFALRVSGFVFAAILAAGAVAACSDAGGVGELVKPGDGTTDPNDPNNPSNPNNPNNPNNPSNPDGGTTNPPTGGSPAQAEALFKALQPELSGACGNSCHGEGKAGAPAFLSPPDVYKSVKNHTGLVVRDVGTSKLLTQGPHTGPALVNPLRDKVIQWLTAESAVMQGVKLPSTEAVAVTSGANSIDISKAASNIAGAKINFTASGSGTIMTLSNIQVVAPATTGVHVVFPVFVIVPATGDEIEDTSFSNADQSFAAGQTGTLNPGTLILTQWSAGAKLRIAFTRLESTTVTGGGGGGCKNVNSFVQNVRAQIVQFPCQNCHNTGGSGNNALDLSGLFANPADNARACAQALNKVNKANPAASPLITAPRGTSPHPGFAPRPGQPYQDSVLLWIQAEQ